MFTNHRPPRRKRLGRNTTDTLKVGPSINVWCLMVIMHHWPLSPGLIVPDHDAVPDSYSRLPLLSSPSFLVPQPAPLAAPLAGAGRRSLGSDTRLKTHQFLGELYRNNICTRVEITLVGCPTFNYSHFTIFNHFLALIRVFCISIFQRSTLVP